MEKNQRIEYIEKKYNIKLKYPKLELNIKNFNKKKYEDLIDFGCSDIFVNNKFISKTCICSGQYIYDIGCKAIKNEKRKCNNCSYYPIVKEWQDEQDIKIQRLKKLNKLNKINESNK